MLKLSVVTSAAASVGLGVASVFVVVTPVVNLVFFGVVAATVITAAMKTN